MEEASDVDLAEGAAVDVVSDEEGDSAVSDANLFFRGKVHP